MGAQSHPTEVPALHIERISVRCLAFWVFSSCRIGAGKGGFSSALWSCNQVWRH